MLVSLKKMEQNTVPLIPWTMSLQYMSVSMFGVKLVPLIPWTMLLQYMPVSSLE